MMRFIDFFAGIGGATIGLKKRGMKCVDMIEKNKFCIEILKKNHEIIPKKDIISIPLTSIGRADLYFISIPAKWSGNYSSKNIIEGRSLEAIVRMINFIEYYLPENILIEMNGAMYKKIGNKLEKKLSIYYPQIETIIIDAKHYIPFKKTYYYLYISAKKKEIKYQPPLKVVSVKDKLEFKIENSLEEKKYVLIENKYISRCNSNYMGYVKRRETDPNIEKSRDEVFFHERIFNSEGLLPSLVANKYKNYHVYHEDRVYPLKPEQCLKLMGFPDDYIFVPNHQESMRAISVSSSPVIIEDLVRNIIN